MSRVEPMARQVGRDELVLNYNIDTASIAG